jgi:hypothetical protein
MVMAIETEGPLGRDRAKNRAIQPRQVHAPGIQEEPTAPAEIEKWWELVARASLMVG